MQTLYVALSYVHQNEVYNKVIILVVNIIKSRVQQCIVVATHVIIAATVIKFVIDLHNVIKYFFRYNKKNFAE